MTYFISCEFCLHISFDISFFLLSVNSIELHFVLIGWNRINPKKKKKREITEITSKIVGIEDR